MVKVVDFHTQFSVHELPGYGRLPADEGRNILAGIAPLLPKILLIADGTKLAVETHQIDTPMLRRSRAILNEVGDIVGVKRLASGEKQGLTKCRVDSPTEISIELIAPDLEAGEHASRDELLDLARVDMSPQLEVVHSAFRDRIVDLQASGCTPPSKTDWQSLVDIGRKYLEMNRQEYAEADAFGSEARLGPLKFSEWRAIAESICAEGFARACIEDCNLAHTGDFSATRFLLMPPTAISSDDVTICIERALANSNSELQDEIKSCFILTAADDGISCDDSDYSYPLLIGSGDTFIMPRYSRLANPYLFLLSRLMRKYEQDLTTARDEREAPFQADLHKLFENENYVIAAPNAKLHEDNGNDLTDIDAAIYEKTTNSVYLFQLFWPDVQADDLKRSDKQYKRLRGKTKWLYDVRGWVDNHSIEELIDRLKLQDCDIDITSLHVKYIMLSRWWTNFSGKKPYDAAGAWVSWSYFQLLLKKSENSNAALAYAYAEARKYLQESRSLSGKKTNYQLGNISVLLTI